MSRITIGLAVGIIFLSLSLAPGVAAAGTHGELLRLKADVHDLDVRFADQETARASQTNTFNADAQTIAISTGAVVLLMTVGGIGAAILGYRFVQSQVKDALAARLDNAIARLGREIFETKATMLMDEYEQMFADEYARYKGLTERADD